MEKIIKKYWLIGLIFISGTALRFVGLGNNPVWIDEVLFTANQEFISAIFWKVLPIFPEFWLRFPSAFFGSLTILVPFLVTKNRSNAILASMFIAFFPIFVYWSRMARPYAISGFFVALSFKYIWFQFIAILNTPFSLIGLDLTNIKKYNYVLIYVLLFVFAIIIFSARPDTGRNFNFNFFTHAVRMWYIPLLSIVFYILKFCDILNQKSKDNNKC